jgi:hypothetical protein
MDASPATRPRPARRTGVIRRALRRETVRIRSPKRALAMVLLAAWFGFVLAGMIARGENAGADAQAYWAAVRIWFEGGDPYHPTGPFLPYVYSPWMLPLFAPWAMLPWDVAWFVWRGGTILLWLWTVRWAYTRRPLATAILVWLLLVPIGAHFDTGNINLLLALALFAAHFTGPRLGGLIWGLATWMKWVPALVWLVLPPRTRSWGLIFLALSGLLSLLMLPLTIVQLQVLFGFGTRPFRFDYLVFVWSIVPWWWRLRHPFAFLDPRAWLAAAGRQRARAARWVTAFRASPRSAADLFGARLRVHLRAYLGLDDQHPAGRTGRTPAVRKAADIGD